MGNNYKSIFKGTMIFGGVQVFQILVSFVRNKLNAIYLGPEGMGIIGLFTSSLSIIITIATMGFGSSAVRFIANEQNEKGKLRIIKASLRLLYAQAFLGFSATVILSYFLSRNTFGNSEYTLSYIILSIYTFVSVLSNGNMAIIQGKQETKRIARANVISSFIGLLLGFPFLIFFKIKAVIPILLLTPIILSIYTTLSVKHITKIDREKSNRDEIISIAKLFISYGIVITLSQLIGTIADYFINIYVTKTGSIKDIGYYNSGMNITYQCIGLVFNAMSMDYSPKLTAVCDDRDKSNALINQQGIVTLLLAVPILCVMMISSPILIRLFLSKEFLPITGFIQIIILGMVFKAITFCLGSVSFAKGDKKIFFFYEGVYGTLQRFILAIIGYKIYGLTGMAWGFVFNFVLYLLTVTILCLVRYKYKPSKEMLLLTGASIFISGILFVFTRFDGRLFIVLEITITLIASFGALIFLERKIGIMAFIKNKFIRK